MQPRWVVLGLCLGLVGCLGPRARSQKPEEAEPREVVIRTVGDVTDVGAQEEIPVVGVGLVVGLRGTGGGAPPPNPFRDHLENDLKKHGQRNVKAVLEDPNCAMVILETQIPASARKGEAIDLKVYLPQGSRCTSLKGGYLLSCELFTYANAKEINGRSADQFLKGHPVVKAEGPVIAGLTGRIDLSEAGEKADAFHNEDPSLKAGQIWGGGKLQIDPPIMLLLRPNNQQARTAELVATRVNATFPGMKYGRDGLASAKNKTVVALGVPMQYRHDLPHYLRVVRAIPLDRTPAPDGPYRKRLAEELLDPVKCLGAAIRLEALGEDSVPLLRPALAAPLPLSRFAAARALTYLRRRDGVEELTRLAKQYPTLRGLCLTTLASLDESICHTKLADLMNDPDPELRYGAFCGLRRLDERAPEVAGEKCKDAFFLHHVASDSAPMVHYLTSRRAEIVMFGRPATLLPGLRVMCGEFTVAAGDDGQVTLKRFVEGKNGGLVQKHCPAQLTDVLKTLAELGGGYADAVDLLAKAYANHKLSCDLYHDALPRLVDAAHLIKAAKEDPSLRTAALGQ